MQIKNDINKRQYPTLLFIMIFFMVMSSLLTFSIPVFIIQIILSFITIPLILNKSYGRAKLYTFIYVFSMAFVFIVYLSNLTSFGLPYYIGGSDDFIFEEKGRMVVDSGIYNPSELLGTVLNQFDNAPFFIVYIATLINFSEIFGEYSTFIPRIINVYLLIWISMIFEYLIIKYGKLSELTASISVGFFAFMPNIQFINSHVFRDTFNMFQVFLVVFLIDKLFNPKNMFVKVFLMIGIVIVTYTMYYTRQNSLLFAGALSVLVIIHKLKIKPWYGIIILLPFIFMSNISKVIKLDYFVERYTDYILQIAGDGMSSYIFAQPLIPFGIVLRAFYAFIVPFPNFFGLFRNSDFLISDFVMFLVYCGVIIQILLIPFLLKRLLIFDWLVIAFFIFFLGIVATTFTFRHVIIYYPFMVALAVDGYFSTSVRVRKTIIFFTILAIMLLGFLYIVLKIY